MQSARHRGPGGLLRGGAGTLSAVHHQGEPHDARPVGERGQAQGSPAGLACDKLRRVRRRSRDGKDGDRLRPWRRGGTRARSGVSPRSSVPARILTPSPAGRRGSCGRGRRRRQIAARPRGRTDRGEAGLLTLAGNCLEVSVGELPYAPLAGALRDADPDADVAVALAALPEDGRREIARIVPDVVTGVQQQPRRRIGSVSRGCSAGCWRCCASCRSHARSCSGSRTSRVPTRPARDFLRFLVQSARSEQRSRSSPPSAWTSSARAPGARAARRAPPQPARLALPGRANSATPRSAARWRS